MEKWDAIVIGAGIGGVTAASLLAKEGKKTLLIEKDDRVGGRALSFNGKELSEKGPEWYKNLLAGQYCYLASSSPSLKLMAEKHTLDGYILDLGYHGVACAGEGYFKKLGDLIGGIDIKINPCMGGMYRKGEFYEEYPINKLRLDSKLYSEFKRIGRKYIEMFGDPSNFVAPDFSQYDSVSMHDKMVELGHDKSEVVYDFWRCYGTLVTTINDPHDISYGDFFRYVVQTIFPLLMESKDVYCGGFTEYGVSRWPEEVAAKFRSMGGEMWLNSKLKKVKIAGNSVTGAVVDHDGDVHEISAPIVVLNIPIQDIFKYADEAAFPAEFVKKAKSLYGYGSLAPYIALNKLPMPADQAARLIKTPCVLPKEEGFSWDVYMAWNVQSYLTPSVAPEGKYLLTAYLPVTEKECANKELILKLVKVVPDFFEKVYPGFKDAIDWELYPVCSKLEGVAKSVSQAGSLKPDVVAPLKGLYFAGDTVRGYGVAMDCACASGILCAQKITGADYGVK